MTGGQEIKLVILLNFILFSRYFVFFAIADLSLLPLLLAILFIQFQDNKVSLKQVPGKNQQL